MLFWIYTVRLMKIGHLHLPVLMVKVIQVALMVWTMTKLLSLQKVLILAYGRLTIPLLMDVAEVAPLRLVLFLLQI